MAGYPLEPLRALRAGDRRARTIELADALTAERAAAEGLAAAEARRDRAAAALAATRAAAADALGRGALAVALAGRDAYARELRARLAAEDAALARARAALAVAAEDTARARGEVGGARAREELVDRHKGRWQEERKRTRERREDDG